MLVTYLEKLNAEQRRAVELGVRGKRVEPAGALLVAAGAGSGKTSTLAHRVAHLIVNYAEPRGRGRWRRGWPAVGAPHSA